jgi:transcriptional regulator PpsR
MDLDQRGLIVDLAQGDGESGLEDRDRWIGLHFVETVTEESRPKVEALLREAADGGELKRRHLSHISSHGVEVPVVYFAMPIGSRSRLLAVGRSLHVIATLQQQLLEAQQSMERDFWRFRQAETRYRLLFQLSAEAVLVVNANTGKIAELNPAAANLPGGRWVAGGAFPSGFDAEGTRALSEAMNRVRATARTEQLRLKSAAGDQEMLVAISLFRQEGGPFFLTRITVLQSDARNVQPSLSQWIEAVQRLPDGFVITGMDGRVLVANPAFLDFVQLATEEQVRGESLGRWLARGGADLGVLLSGVREHGSLRLFATALRGDYGATTDVEISAAAMPVGDQTCLAFSIRNVGRRLGGEGLARKNTARSVEQLTELVGKVPLKELVRESTDVIERLCIEAALELTGDNRASAAEMLGLSRQSLYVKLRRYGLVDLSPEAESR